MRELTTRPRLEAFMRALGQRSRERGRVYLVGGASAVLLDWRASTVDIDIELDRSLEPLLRELPALKEALQVNVELASPGHFIPELPGWRERSPFIGREGLIDFHHYDFYAQALAKIERGHARDHEDLEKIVASGLIDPGRLLPLFSEIEGELYRYPALNRVVFRRAVEDAVARFQT